MVHMGEESERLTYQHIAFSYGSAACLQSFFPCLLNITEVALVHHSDDVLALLERLLVDGLYTVPFSLAFVEGVECTDDFVGFPSLLLQIAAEGWGSDALVGGVENPVEAEGDVRPVQTLGACDVEIAAVDELA